MLKPFDNYNLKLMSSISLLSVIMFCGIVTVQGQAINSSEWKFESQRKEIAPVWYVDSNISYKGKPTLVLSGGGKEYSNGHWYTVMNVEPDEYFQFEANFIATNVEEPTRNILARIIWQDVSGKNVGYAEYPTTFLDKTSEGWNYMKQLYRVPDSARKAKIELIYRWDANGIVHFGGTSFQKTTSPKP